MPLFDNWQHDRILLVENRHQPILQGKFTQDADPPVPCQHGPATGPHGLGDIAAADKPLVESRDKLPGTADVEVVSHGHHAADSRLDQGRGHGGEGVFRPVVDTRRLTGIEHHDGDAVVAEQLGQFFRPDLIRFALAIFKDQSPLRTFKGMW